MVQEPHTRSGRISNIDKNLRIFSPDEDKYRVGIITSKNFPAWKLSQFTNEDQVTIATNIGNKTFVITSVYLPYDDPNLPPTTLLQDLVSLCSAKNWYLLIGTDANSHSTAWGSSNNNERGDALLNYVATTNLHICNTGNKPTFINNIREEVIDVTFATNNLIDFVEDWHVTDWSTHSDHRMIELKVNFASNTLPLTRNIRRTDWFKYESYIINSLPNILLFQECNLSEKAEQLETALTTAYEKACPMPKKTRQNKPKWWNKEVSKAKNIYEKYHRKYRIEKSDSNHAEMRSSHNDYKRAIKTAKRDSWRKFCSDIDNLPDTAKLNKIIQIGKNRELGTVRKSDDTFTETPKETLQVLLETLFPDAPEGGGDCPPLPWE